MGMSGRAIQEKFKKKTRMWADAQRDGLSVEYRWHPLLNAAKFGWRPVLECRTVTLPIQETVRLVRKVNFELYKIPLGGKSPENVYTVSQKRPTFDLLTQDAMLCYNKIPLGGKSPENVYTVSQKRPTFDLL